MCKLLVAFTTILALYFPTLSHAGTRPVSCGSFSALALSAASGCDPLLGEFFIEVVNPVLQASTGTSGTTGPKYNSFQKSLSGVIRVTRSVTRDCPEGCIRSGDLPSSISVKVTATLSSNSSVQVNAPPPSDGNNVLVNALYTGPGDLLPDSYTYAHSGDGVQSGSHFSSSDSAIVSLTVGDHPFTLDLSGYTQVNGTGGFATQGSDFVLSAVIAPGVAATFTLPCVPEPQTWALAIVGLGTVASRLKKRRPTEAPCSAT